ncbi:MAG: hypothetical protein INF44_04835 [Thalassospira sp.]|nr:hypothetical protein [Thalassospira sp.]
MDGKTIDVDIVFTQPRETALVFVASRIPINSSSGVKANLDIRYVPVNDYSCFNVTIEGTGQVCRLEHNANVHRNAGRDHKHTLQNEDCPQKDIPSAVSFPGLSGKTVKEIFTIFCKSAHINHSGDFIEPGKGKRRL